MAEGQKVVERPGSAGATEREASAEDRWPVPRVEGYGPRNGPTAWLQYLAARATLGLLTRMPHVVQRAFVGGLARFMRVADRRHTDAARVFLRQAHEHQGKKLTPAELEAQVLQAWRHFLEVTIESAGLERNVPADRLAEHYDVQGTPEAERYLENPTGCIMVTGHVGNWEAFTAALDWMGFGPAYVIGKPPRNRPLSVYLQGLRERRAVRVLPRRGAMKDVPRILAAGGSVGMMLDQRARVKPVMASFFGRQASCDRSVGVLIRRVKAPVIFVACYRTGVPYGFRIELSTVMQPEAFSGLGPEEVVEKINRELERMILAAPEQYFWLHERYRGAPEGAPKSDTDAESVAREAPPVTESD